MVYNLKILKSHIKKLVIEEMDAKMPEIIDAIINYKE